MSAAESLLKGCLKVREARFSVVSPKSAERVLITCGKALEARFSAISFQHPISTPAERMAAESTPPLRSKGVLSATSSRVDFVISNEQRRMREMIDLTKMLMPTDFEPVAQSDHGASAVAKVDVIFRNHRERLIEEIRRYPVVVGCVAWLTDYAVLEALATRQRVGIVVQKEDFLKPDTRSSNRRLKALYDALPHSSRWELPHTSGFSYCSGGDGDSIRCVGNHNAEKKPAWPRMHNKFLVFCELVKSAGDESGHLYPAPMKVWTGSYNISDNASRSWENAVIIDDATIAEAYAKEFGQIFGFSEPLDWQSDWAAPTYRIGS